MVILSELFKDPGNKVQSIPLSAQSQIDGGSYQNKVWGINKTNTLHGSTASEALIYNYGNGYRYLGRITSQTGSTQYEVAPTLGQSAVLTLQPTGLAKKCTVKAFSGNTLVEDGTRFFRVYREVTTLNKIHGNYVPPNYDINSIGQGSIGYNNHGFWNIYAWFSIWWIVMDIDQGDGGDPLKKAIMVDAGYIHNDLGRVSSPPSIKGTGMYLTSGMGSLHSGEGYGSTNGINFYRDTTNLNWYIKDLNSTGIEYSTNAEVALKEKPAMRLERKVYSYPDVAINKLNENRVSGFTGQTETINTKTYTYSAVGFDSSYDKSKPEYIGILVDEDTAANFTDLSESLVEPVEPSAPAKTTANFIKPNIEIVNSQTNIGDTGAKWYPKKHSSTGKFFNLQIIDGATLPAYSTGGTSPYLIDTEWLSTAVNTPASYWYIIPQQTRGKGSNALACCLNISGAGTAGSAGAVANFTGTSATCGRGRHFGKFLKSSFPSSSSLTPWANYVEAVAEHNLISILSETRFDGYIKAPTRPGQGGVFLPIEFTLKDEPVFLNKSSYLGGLSPKVKEAEVPTVVTVSTKTAAVIKEELNARFKASQATLIEKWTLNDLKVFAQNSASAIGVSLAEIKMSFLEIMLDAKSSHKARAERITPEAARKKLQNDPTYLALEAFLTTTATGSGPRPAGSNSNSGGNNNQTSGTSPNAQPSPPKTIRIQVDRGLPGYKQGIRQATVKDKPELVQTYQYFQRQEDGTDEPITELIRFTFPFVPREVTYSGIGAKWMEIERTGNYPLVDWQGFQLLKLSFSFDVVDTRYKDKAGFGYYFSCEDEITKLRKMAQSPYPVTFLNLDRFVTDEVRYPLTTQSRGIEFVIQEFTVTAVQRTPPSTNTEDNPAPNQIARATCSMTLQEIPIERIDIVQMPPIKPCKPKDCPPPTTPTELLRTYALFTPNLKVTG